MGMDRDQARREQNIRRDDEHRKGVIERARTFIYHQGLGLSSAAINRFLGPESWVPTRASLSQLRTNVNS